MPVDLQALQRFRELMADQGFKVQTLRMLFDRLYAHQRLAWAHRSPDAELRAVALGLFRALHAADGAGPLFGTD